MLYSEDDHVAPITPPMLREAAQIAQALLSRSGWTGAQIQELERVAAMQEDDPDVLGWMEDMRDAKEREDALNK